MSNNGSEVLKVLAEKFCSCGLCGNTLNAPRLLPCFHTFCSTCLELYIKQQVSEKTQPTFPCPTCSRPISVPQGTAQHSYVDGFKADTFVEKLQEVIQAFGEDKTCDVCSRRSVPTAASSWCMDCYDALCEDCTKVHLCGRTTADHIVVSLAELRKLSLENILKRTASQRCGRHQEDLVKLYCVDCNEPVCVQCLASSHRKCENCVPVSDAMKQMEDDVTEVMGRLRSINSEGVNDVTAYESGAEVLEESVKKAETGIRALADDLRRRIDENEHALLERLHSITSQLNEKVGDFRNMLGSREDDVKTLSAAQDRMEILLKYGSDLDILDVYNKVKDTMARLDGTGSSAASTSDDEVRLKVNFDVDEPVKVFSRDFEKLGEIRVEDCNSDDGLSSWGVTVTSRDEIIVADCRNKKVQKFSSTGDLIDHIQISEEPRDITSFGDDDVAMTIMKREIFIVTVTGNMMLKRRFKTERQYDGIAYSTSGHSFLVSSLEDNCVDVISPQGDVTITFNVNGNTGQPIFSVPRYVAITKEGHYVISDAAHNSLTCITQEGALLFTYAPKESAHELKKAQGICCDKIGNLFVGDYANSRVHLLTSDGNFQRFVLGRDSGLRRPVALAMTHTNKLVVVQSDGMVKIFSYESMKVKLKVICWCPRCISNTEKAEGVGGHLHDNQDGADSNGRRLSTSGMSDRSASSIGSGGNRRVSESYMPRSAGGIGSNSQRISDSFSPRYPLSPRSPLSHSSPLSPRNKQF